MGSQNNNNVKHFYFILGIPKKNQPFQKIIALLAFRASL
jgi:hypothetical protein